jgi:hypothetical protein
MTCLLGSEADKLSERLLLELPLDEKLARVEHVDECRLEHLDGVGAVTLDSRLLGNRRGGDS